MSMMMGDSPDEAAVMQSNMDEKRAKTELLASRYTRTKRNLEIFFCCTAISLICISFVRVCNLFFLKNIWVFLCACVLSMLVTDFFSGIFHWGADTWGSIDTPGFGAFIRSFREHHIAPVAMCKHDFFEVNGDSFMLVLPVLLVTALTTPRLDVYYLFVHNFMLLVALWVGLTNQVHKWTHTYKLPRVVQLMMDCGLVLSKRDHAIHHRNPFDKYYCITNGWLNPVLANIDFWSRLEAVITFITGYQPREDDMLWVGVTAKLE